MTTPEVTDAEVLCDVCGFRYGLHGAESAICPDGSKGWTVPPTYFKAARQHDPRPVLVHRNVIECCECDLAAVAIAHYITHQSPVCSVHAAAALQDDDEDVTVDYFQRGQHDPRSTTEGLGAFEGWCADSCPKGIHADYGVLAERNIECPGCVYDTLATKAAQWDAAQGVVEAARRLVTNAGGLAVTNAAARQLVQLEDMKNLADALAALDTPTEHQP